MDNRLSSVASLVAALATCSGALADGDVIVDRISNPALWTDAGPMAQQMFQALTRANGAVSFIGNGQQLESISMLFGNSLSSTFNAANVSLFDFRFTLYSSTADFISDPFGLNRPAGWLQVFETPSNANWLNVVGSANGRELRRADFDLTALNIDLTAGQNYLAAVTVLTNQEFGNGFMGFARPGGVGTELDWYASNTLGPATLDSLNAPQDRLAYRITTRSPHATSCLADLAGGTAPSGPSPDGTIDGTDFIAFINSFAIGDTVVDSLADVAGSGSDGLDPDGTIDGSDFIAFINAFAAGC